MFRLGLSILICSAFFQSAYAQEGIKITEAEAVEPAPINVSKDELKSLDTNEYLFKSTASKKEKAKIIGRLKFVEVGAKVRLEFSGTNLQKGNYKIFKIDSCESYKKAKTKSAAGEDIFSFETKYGEISDEKNLSVTKVKDLNLEDKSFALVKTAGKALTLIACSEE
ncbi:MAG: hypothetical protein H7256_09100 [Bdellovibrio sp.]|nr:hypothetical protein [Bdellovibrio sp.]